jgi:uncharacterized protein YdeI (YjbR/CyaY-like superfamily)
VEPVYFSSAAEFRMWLDQHHQTEAELVVGFYKKGTGKQSMTWAEAVDEALCFGWIDSVGRRVDDHRYTIRFTLRKPSSTWSNRNIERVAVLSAAGLMQPAGTKAFEKRTEDRSGIYSFEQNGNVSFSSELEELLGCNLPARTFFEAQAPWYQRAATHWVMSAKRESTRARRMHQLIEDSAEGRTIKPLTRSR